MMQNNTKQDKNDCVPLYGQNRAIENNTREYKNSKIAIQRKKIIEEGLRSIDNYHKSHMILIKLIALIMGYILFSVITSLIFFK